MRAAKKNNAPPMPLKHLTETLLIVLLGIVTVATGFVLSTLPHLPPGILPWLILFVITLIYPAVLYPLLKNNRADYEFRALHFLPAVVAVLWLLLASLTLRFAFLSVVLAVLTFAWSLPFVFVSFLLIILFCFSVVRRVVPRIVFLLLIFVPYLALAVAATAFHEDRKIAAVVWHGTWWNITGVTPGQESSSGKYLAYSSNPEEELWRQKIRQFEEGTLTQTGSALSSVSSSAAPLIVSFLSSSSHAIVSSSSSSVPLIVSSLPSSVHSSVSSSSSSAPAVVSSSSSSAPAVVSSSSSSLRIVSSSSSSASSIFVSSSSSSKPTRLPSAGSETDVLLLSLVGLYVGVLHQRAKRRKANA